MSQPSRNKRDLLFVSYAYEDEVFARWLSRKLAFYGYGVWFDQIKLLGGESWVDDIDVAIKEQSVRVLGILSKDSIRKKNPRKERTLAQQVGNKLGIDDFLITLNLDGTEPDWTVSDISWIPFNRSWAEGLRRLLKKLDHIEAPRIHGGNPAIARAQISRGEDLVSEEPESLVTNWLPFDGMPETLKVYDAPGVKREDLKDWPCFNLGYGKVLALSEPPSGLKGSVKATDAHRWDSIEMIETHKISSILVVILNQVVSRWLRAAGCEHDKKHKEAHLPEKFGDETILRFADVSGKQRHIHTTGKVTFRVPSGPPEKITYHNSIRYRTRKLDSGQYVVQLTPAVALFDHKHKPVEGRKVNARRKKVTGSWYNEKWRLRMMAFAQLLADSASKDELVPFSLDDPIQLLADKRLEESALKPVEDENVEGSSMEAEIVIGIDEMEGWEE